MAIRIDSKESGENEFFADDFEPVTAAPEFLTVRVGITLEEMAKLLMAATLRQCGGSVRKAAIVLGIDRATLYKKVKQYDIRKSRSGWLWRE